MTIEDASGPVENVDECDDCLVLLDDNDLKGVSGGQYFNPACYDAHAPEVLIRPDDNDAQTSAVAGPL